jgi:hypothetical protein
MPASESINAVPNYTDNWLEEITLRSEDESRVIQRARLNNKKRLFKKGLYRLRYPTPPFNIYKIEVVAMWDEKKYTI